MKKTPIYDAVNSYVNKNTVRMHMPGHKGRHNGFLAEASQFDLTEVNGTDSLYESCECILECEKEYAKLFNSKCSLISASGSTLCIQTMLAMVAGKNKKIIAGRNIHISAVNAMGLLGLEPIWVYPSFNNDNGVFGEISHDEIEKAIKNNNDVGACYITTPDYFGVLSDVKKIAEICHKYDIPLIVDNAHGAILKFLTPSYHPMDLGADMCCDSLHKTLPVLTGGAVLHIANEKYINSAKECMSLFGTTSPSYLIMQSIDMAIDYIKNNSAYDYNKLEKWVFQTKQLAVENGFSIPFGLTDKFKLVLGFAKLGYTPEQFYEKLKEYNIEPEYMSQTHCVFMPMPFNTQNELETVEALIKNTKPIGKEIFYDKLFTQPKTEKTIREAMFSPKITVNIDDACGKIAAAVKTKCPPGIPLLIPGEIIDKKIIKILKYYGILELNVIQC